MNNLDLNLFSTQIVRYLFRLKTSIEEIILPVVQPYGLTILSTAILLIIDCQKNITIGGVNHFLKINQGNLSTMCKKLEKKGFLSRIRDKEDERVVLLTLTKYGQETITKIEKELLEIESYILNIPKEEVLSAKNGLKEFIELLEVVEENAPHNKKERIHMNL